jgi:hypothetical protein
MAGAALERGEPPRLPWPALRWNVASRRVYHGRRCAGTWRAAASTMAGTAVSERHKWRMKAQRVNGKLRGNATDYNLCRMISTYYDDGTGIAFAFKDFFGI